MRVSVLVIFICSFRSVALCDKFPLLTDNTVTTTSEILARIQSDGMVDIKAKYSDLQKNFTPHFLTTGIDFDCHGGTAQTDSGGNYAGLRISNDSKKLADGRTQSFSSASHFDCYGRLLFTERIKVIAPTPKTLTVQDAVKFVRNFEVLDDESSRQYQIENAKAETIFSVSSQRTVQGAGQRIYSSIDVAGTKWLEFNQLDPSTDERRLFVQLYSGTFQVGESQFRLNFGDAGSVVLKTFWTDRQISHYVDTTLSNQITFDSFLGANVIGLTAQVLQLTFASFIKLLPETKKVQIGVSDSPFLRELQLNYNRVLTNTEAEQVKLFFQKTIDAIKTGRLKVD